MKPSEALGETTPGGILVPGRRYAHCNDIVLVPKHALSELPADAHKVEQGYYDGRVGGFGGMVDAR